MGFKKSKGIQQKEFNSSCLHNYWDKEKENIYDNLRNEKRVLYSNEVTSTNWRMLSLLPFV